MSKVLRYTLQIFFYALFAVFIGYFSTSPAFQYGSADNAVIKLSLSHAAERVAPCVRLTPAEVAALAPNMRRTESCVRERLPLLIEMDLDGERVLSRQAPPSGLWGDGPASVYEQFGLPPGTYQVSLRLRDSADTGSWDYTHTADIELVAGRYLTITFKAETGGFRIR